MNKLRGNTKTIFKNKKDLEVQIIDWETLNINLSDSNNENSGDDNSGDNNSDSDNSDYGENKKKYNQNNSIFHIRAYGNTIKGTSVTLNINGFPPHFYINIPEEWNDIKVKMFMKSITNKIPFYFRNDIITYDVVKRKKFWGFTNNQLFKFVRILFKTTQALYQVSKLLKKNIKIPGLGKNQKYEVYESNIPPLLRFIHINDIFPAGWVKINSEDYKINYDNESNTQLTFDVHWKNIKSIKTKLDMAPFIIASYDIEADSKHGDFPLAKKNYLKFCQEIATYYYTEYDAKKKINLESVYLDFINYAFDDTIDNQSTISKLYTKFNIKPIPIKRKIAAKQLCNIFKRKEDYKILVSDILSNIHIGQQDDDEPKKNIKCIIEDAYCDIDEAKSLFSINKMFTKLNTKPTKPLIVKISKSIETIYGKLLNNLKDEDTKIVYKILEYYNRVYFFENNQEKIDFYYTKFDFNKQTVENILKIITITSNQIMSVLKENLPEIDSGKEIKIKRCNIYLSNLFPEIEGDTVIQIGTAVQKYGDSECFIKHIVTLGTCDPIPGCIVVSCKTEKEVLLEWTKFITELDPDLITGYNIFGFDYSYMYERAEELECIEEFTKLSRIKDKSCDLTCKKLASSALGDNTLKYIQMDGRVNADLLKIIQRDHNLVSYKLDYVAEHFINDKILEIEKSGTNTLLTIKNVKNLNKGNFITIYIDDEKYNNGKKYKIIEIDNDTITINDNLEDILTLGKCTWRLAKDDVSPQDIFRLQKGSSADRCIVATYCIQDCVLCLHIINKLQIITNNIAMANTCSVPLSFIFLRGQGIKVFSLVSKQCRKDKFLIPVIKHDSDETKISRQNIWDYNEKHKFEYGLMDEDIPILDDSYEGAIVLKPKPGIYLDKYIVVLDYASLYPSSMIGDNYSHDSICLDKKYLGEKGAKELERLGLSYSDQSHDVYKWVDNKDRNKGKYKSGVKTCRFVQFPNDEKSVIPRILQDLLSARKATRAKIKTEPDEFKKAVLDGQQLSYKITANSVYGGIGASTNAVCMKDLAASTTSKGRELLYLAKNIVEENFPGSEVIYGDTDSIFIDFSPKDEGGNLLTGKEGLKRAIELGVEAEKEIQKSLKKPHKCEYEKTFYPFILFSKKRYIGYKYEFDIEKYKETSMGIVLKRRDNAKIVKHVYGGVIDKLLKEKNINKSIEFINTELNKLLDGKFPMDMLIITKSLRGFYKNPNQIAHKVLADRMGERDPGNKPSSNDRIPYVYIETKESKNNKVLQGDKVEHPQFIIENNIKPDYKFYITNQIMKPVGQIYSLIVETLEGFKKPKDYYEHKYKYLLKTLDKEKAKTKISDEKFKDASELVFGEVLRKATNKKNRAREISDFFKVTGK